MGSAGIDSLAHFGVVDDHRNRVIRTDPDERVGPKAEHQVSPAGAEIKDFAHPAASLDCISAAR